MDSNSMAFLGLALSIGFVHTLLGPDHYLPFIVLSRARGWNLAKTLWITFACAVGHVLSSVLLGFLGVGFGWAVGDLVVIEGQRGTVAGWLLLSFGIVYFLWGLKQGLIRKTHTHHHQHAHGIDHTHEADPPHASMHAYEHLSSRHQDRNGTPWWLFLIFVFGPCEPLIPVLMYPAVQKDVTTLMLVTLAFSVVTVATMMSVVTLAYKGLNWIRVDALERWTHALAGGSIALVAAGMVFFGW